MKLSVQETVVETNIQNMGSTETYLVYNDADGTEHYFKKDATSGEYKDEDGLNLTITKSGEHFTMKDEKDNKKYFHNGYLTWIKDANGNAVYILYNGGSYSATNTSAWYPRNSTTNKITKIVTVQSGSSSTITIATLAYRSDNYLQSITDYAGRKKEYDYTSGYLTWIKDHTGIFDTSNNEEIYVYRYRYPGSDGLGVVYNSETKNGLHYSYTDSATGRMIQGIASYYAASYPANDFGTNGEIYTGVVSCDGTKLLETTYTDAGEDCDLSTGADNLSVTYKLDNWGRTVNASSTDNTGRLLGVTASAYSNNSGTSKKNNRLLQGVSTGVLNANMIADSGMEFLGAGWNKRIEPSIANCNIAWKNEPVSSRSGAGMVRMYIPSGAQGQDVLNYAWQNQTLTANTKYTFSAYVKVDSMENVWNGGGVYITIYDSSWNIVATSDVVDYVTSGIDDGWEQLYVNYTPETSGTYKVVLCQKNCGKSQVAFDDVQLETGSVASSYNMVIDAGFEQGSSSWTRSDTSAVTFSSSVSHDGGKSVKIQGSPTGTYNCRQYIGTCCDLDTTFVLSAWAKADSAQNLSTDSFGGDKRFFGIIAWLQYSDGSWEYKYLPFSSSLSDWQYNSVIIAPKKSDSAITLDAITLYCSYYNNVNAAYFDNISLVKEPAQTYTYDEKGNLTAVNQKDSETSATYDSASNLLSTATAGSGTYTYEHDSKHNVTKATNDIVEMNISYSAAGEALSTTLKNNKGTTLKEISTSASYTNGLSTAQVDALGKTTSYGYDGQRRTTSVTNAKDVSTATTYFGNLNRPKMSYISGKISLEYLYANGQLSKITRGGYVTPGVSGATKYGQVYSFLYDKFGRSTGVSVAGNSLVTYAYAKDGSYDPKSMTYGNGAVANYTYDIFGRVIKQTYSGTNSSGNYSYTYDANGNLWRVTDSTDSNNPVVYNYDYDSLGRLIRSNKKKNGTTQLRTEHLYDSENRIKSQKWELPGKKYTEQYTYNTSNGSLTELKTSAGTISFVYDDLLRLQTRTASPVIENYTYIPGGNGANTTSTQIQQIAYTGVTSWFTNTTLSYTYDELGNIKTVTQDGITTEYFYDDDLGYLTKEETRNASGTTTHAYTYSYDTYGNIRQKKEYSGSVSSANLVNTYTYTYPTNGWLDCQSKLTISGVASGTFTYDAIGNPTKYYNGRTYDFEWRNGRQLEKATVGSKEYTYTYDINGVRDSKTANGVTHYYSTLSGQVVRDTWTENGTTKTLDILPDNNSKPYALVYNDGTETKTYYYVLNQQGDVIRLVNGNGATVASYTYNAWGEILSVKGPNGNVGADHIANINPIRYRGYYYDTETKFYYVGGRYYDPMLCRFINADNASLTTINPDGFTDKNLFAYCDNDPVNRTDDGGSCWAIAGGAIAGGIIGAAS
ncbi:MAG: RHS repeat-associated core domain-containing protein [Oscillospiraceae bacterium]